MCMPMPLLTRMAQSRRRTSMIQSRAWSTAGITAVRSHHINSCYLCGFRGLIRKRFATLYPLLTADC